MKRFQKPGLLALGIALATCPAFADNGGTTQAIYQLPEISLGTFIQNTLGLSVSDHNIKLGGIGSDLFHDSADPDDIFYMITDRGPNSQIRPAAGKSMNRTFPVPEFTPTILKVKLESGEIKIVQAIPIKRLNLTGVTGLSNYSGTSPRGDDRPYACNGIDQLFPGSNTFNPNGMDTEGLVRDKNGNFWVAEENRPSLVKISPSGVVQNRFIPIDDPLTGANYTVTRVFPALMQKRRSNRGFEGLAISPNGKTIYTMLQSPERHPSTSAGNASRNIRIFQFDIASETVTAEYVYVLEDVATFDPAHASPSEMKVSGMAMVDTRRILVLERTDWVAKVYRIDLNGATDILGSIWDNEAQSPSLTQLGQSGSPTLAASNITPVSKDLVVDLDVIDANFDKVEGIALINKGNNLVIANDNDFGISDQDTAIADTPTTPPPPGHFYGAGCMLNPSGRPSQIRVIKTDNPLKK